MGCFFEESGIGSDGFMKKGKIVEFIRERNGDLSLREDRWREEEVDDRDSDNKCKRWDKDVIFEHYEGKNGGRKKKEKEIKIVMEKRFRVKIALFV